MKIYTEEDMITFSDWCHNNITNLKYSDLRKAGSLLEEWKASLELTEIKQLINQTYASLNQPTLFKNI